jgi:hypothetical protein
VKLFRITLKVLDGHANDPHRRLALGLKYLLRACGLECVRFEHADAPPPAKPVKPRHIREAAD